MKTFLLTLGAILGLFYVQNLYDNLGDLLDKKASARDILEYYLLITPSLLTPVMPLSILIATLLSYGGLHKNQEINSIRAIGSGLFHLIRGNLLIILLITGGLYWLSMEGLSWSVERSREKFETIRSDYASKNAMEEGNSIEWEHQIAFENRTTRQIWVCNRFHKPTQTAYGVYLYFRDRSGSEKERLTARSAKWNPQSLMWDFREGRRVYFDESGHPLRFENFQIRSISDLDEPGTLLAPKRKLSDLSLRELQAQARAGSEGSSKDAVRYQIRYHQALAAPINCILGFLIGVPFAIAGQRINPMVGATRAIGIFVGYFLLSGFCRMLGEHALLVPAAAGWLPPVVFSIYSLRLLFMVR